MVSNRQDPHAGFPVSGVSATVGTVGNGSHYSCFHLGRQYIRSHIIPLEGLQRLVPPSRTCKVQGCDSHRIPIQPFHLACAKDRRILESGGGLP